MKLQGVTGDSPARARRRARLAGLVAFGGLAAACTPLAGPGVARTPSPPEVVEIDMRDHAYQFENPRLQAGRVVFRVTNHGGTDHDLILTHLPDGTHSVSEWLDGGEGGFQPIYIMAERSPGKTGVFAVDLPAGKYGLLCSVEDPDGTPHYRRGMVAELRIGGAGSPTATSEPESPDV